MSLLIIRGTAEVIRGLDDVAGLMIDRESARSEGTLWRVSAHATDAAAAEVRSRGATVEILMTSTALSEHLSRALAQVVRSDGNESPGGG